MRAPALLVFLPLLLAPVLSEPSVDPAPRGQAARADPRPTHLFVNATAPAELHVGQEKRVEVTVQRRANQTPVPGPGEVDVSVHPTVWLTCRPRHATVELDPATGRGHATATCKGTRPGSAHVSVQARSEASRPGWGNASLVVLPDALEGRLVVGEPGGYRIPVVLQLEPTHLEAAEVNLTIEGSLQDSPLGFLEGPQRVVVDGSSLHLEPWARHGPGTYRLDVRVEGPLTRPWADASEVSVPQPPAPGRLELNVSVAPGQPRVELAPDAVNDDGKRKRPGDGLITRLRAHDAQTVNVSVVRRPTNDSRVLLSRDTLDASNDSHLEHVFQHEPLPAGRLWVHAVAGDSSVGRTARILDLEASARTTGPGQVLGDGRPWEGIVVIEDPNFGSTPQDPGPVFGLPNLTWTVYRGSATAEGFDVRVGPFQGGSQGAASTNRIPWPQGAPSVDVSMGRAKFPVAITPPPDVDPGTYRWSVYAPDGDRIGGARWTFTAPPEVALHAGPPRPGNPWPVGVELTRSIEGARVRVQVQLGDQVLLEETSAGNGSVLAELPTPIAAGENVTVRAWADWPGRPSTDEPDQVRSISVPELAPNVTVHALLDGVPTRPPLDLHPATSHRIQLVHQAIDPNTGPVNVSARLVGPSEPEGWTLDRVSDHETRLRVPANATVGRYEVKLEATSAGQTRRVNVPLDVAPTLRLALDGPDRVRLSPDQPRTVDLTVQNAGSLPVANVTALVHTELDLEAEFSTGEEWRATGTGLPVDLEPGEATQLELRLTARQGPQRAPVNVTIAGTIR